MIRSFCWIPTLLSSRKQRPIPSQRPRESWNTWENISITLPQEGHLSSNFAHPLSVFPFQLLNGWPRISSMMVITLLGPLIHEPSSRFLFSFFFFHFHFVDFRCDFSCTKRTRSSVVGISCVTLLLEALCTLSEARSARDGLFSFFFFFFIL